MLTVEHEAAEILRHMRLKDHSVRPTDHYILRWIFELLGWHSSNENRAELRAGKNCYDL